MDLPFPLSRRNLPEGHPSSAQEIITQIIHSLNANLCLFPDRVAFAYGTFVGKYCNFSNYHQSHYYQTEMELHHHLKTTQSNGFMWREYDCPVLCQIQITEYPSTEPCRGWQGTFLGMLRKWNRVEHARKRRIARNVRINLLLLYLVRQVLCSIKEKKKHIPHIHNLMYACMYKCIA